MPSEAFARVELRGLRDAGCLISASTLRAPGRERRELLREHGLEDMLVSYSGPLKWLSGLAKLVRHPTSAWRVCHELFPQLTGRWKDMLASCTLLPRAFGIASEVRKLGVDHVHLFWGHYPSLVGLALGELGARCSLSMSLGAYDLVRQSPLSRLLAHRAPVLTHARVNIGPIGDLAGISHDRIKVIYRGIEVTDAPGAGERSDFPHALIVERLIPEKRTIDAISAFARARESIPRAVLTVLGDGPSRDGLEEWVRREGLQDSVRFRGRVSHEEVQEAMSRVHVVLSMTQSPGERLPNAVKEAMCKECAVVVARSPGIDELVQHGVSGYIVERGEVDQAAERLIELLGDIRQAARLGKNGRARILEKFDIAATTRQRLACWFPDVGVTRARVN